MHEVTIKVDDSGFRWHLSQPGHPGLESDSFATIEGAIGDYLNSEYSSDIDLTIRVPEYHEPSSPEGGNPSSYE